MAVGVGAGVACRAPTPVARHGIVAEVADEPAVVAVFIEPAPQRPPSTPGEPALPVGPATALQRSLDYLARDGEAWMRGESPLNEGNGCISCHVVGFSLWSHRAAARAGVVANEAELEALTAEAVEFIGRPGKGRAVSWGQMLLGRSAGADPTGPEWRAMVDGIVASREPAGYWRARGQFPSQRRSERESDAVATMWSLLALDSMAAAGKIDSELLERALFWIERSGDSVSTEWLAMRVLVEGRFGDSERAARWLAELVAEQHGDGGWGWQLAGSAGDSLDPSNAYSTGVALYALRRAQLETSHPAVGAAVDYLLATQRGDGTWAVPSRLISAEPSAGKDYVYEYWGTAWAVIGLAELPAG